MKNHKWSKKTLCLLEEWDWVTRFIEMHAPGNASIEDKHRQMYLEACLLIENKLVIVYFEDIRLPSSIVSFKELVKLRENPERLHLKGYHPINFKHLDEFHTFLSGLREEIFSLN